MLRNSLRVFQKSYSICHRAMTTVFITRQLPEHLLQPFHAKNIKVSMWPSPDKAIPRTELLRDVAGCQALLCMLSDRVDAEVLQAAGPQLKVVSTLSVGYDHVDVPTCHASGVRLGHTPDVLTDATADLTMTLLLAVCRHFQEASAAVRDGLWGTWQPFWLCGRSLSTCTVGVVGAGRIGRAVMQRLKGFNVSQLLYCTSGKASSATAEELGNGRHVAFEQLLAESDIVVVCCALTPTTRQLFNSAAFAAMKPQALFINTSRGDVVEQPALVAALRSGQLGGAGLDVTTPEPLPVDSELLQLRNCVVLPHIGSATVDSRESMVHLAVENVLAALEARAMPAEVKPPSSAP